MPLPRMKYAEPRPYADPEKAAQLIRQRRARQRIPVTIATGSSNIYISLGASAFPVAAYQFNLNSQSSAHW